MNTNQLVKMANEIAAFFAGSSGPEQAPQEVAMHLRKYWEPRMRREIVAYGRTGGIGLSDVARAAVVVLTADSQAVDS